MNIETKHVLDLDPCHSILELPVDPDIEDDVQYVIARRRGGTRKFRHLAYIRLGRENLKREIKRRYITITAAAEAEIDRVIPTQAEVLRRERRVIRERLEDDQDAGLILV